MLSQLGHLPRIVRLTLLVTLLVVVPTLYLLHPRAEYVPSPGDVQAGGIDGEHWRRPITPHLDEYTDSTEQVREWDDELPLVQGQGQDQKNQGERHAWGGVSEETLAGGVIMPKLGNETAKAELGRSAWRVLHLMTLRYPDNPTEDDRQALKSYFHLFSRLYPCGECATEFQMLLKEYPPQTSSRKSASLWLCHVHNLVNARLGKAEFDCLTLDATYDCGCGDESASASASDAPAAKETGAGHHVESGEWDGQRHGPNEEEVGRDSSSGYDSQEEALDARPVHGTHHEVHSHEVEGEEGDEAEALPNHDDASRGQKQSKEAEWAEQEEEEEDEHPDTFGLGHHDTQHQVEPHKQWHKVEDEETWDEEGPGAGAGAHNHGGEEAPTHDREVIDGLQSSQGDAHGTDDQVDVEDDGERWDAGVHDGSKWTGEGEDADW